MPPKQSIWFRIGYALEQARGRPTPGAKLRGLRERVEAAAAGRERAPARPPIDDLVVSGSVAAGLKLLDAVRPRERTRLGGLLRAGAAGAVAALVVDLLRPLVRGPRAPLIDEETPDRLLVGVGQGLLYGAVVEPRVPGPPLMKGALYGTAEYAVDPAGGLTHLLGEHAPHRRLPVVARLMERVDPHDRAYLEQVVFGVALALLYGSSPSSNGIRVEGEGE